MSFVTRPLPRKVSTEEIADTTNINFTLLQSTIKSLESQIIALKQGQNKQRGSTFLDSIFRVKDNGDASKQIALEAEDIATGTTRTINVPDRNIDLTEYNYFEELLCTGFIGTPPALSINGGDNTKFDITGGTILVSDSSTTPPTLTELSFSSQSAVTPTFIASETASFISIDSTGAIIQRNSRADAEERRNTSTVGLVSHIDNLIIEDVVNTPQIIANQACNFADLARALGFFSTSGNSITGISSGLTMSKSVGTGFSLNENAGNNNKDPHGFNMAALSPATIISILRDATVETTSTSIDPTIYDLAGVATAVPSNNNATIHRLYVFPNNSVVLLIAQEVFANFNDAKETTGAEIMTVPTDLIEGALLLGRWVMKKNCTDLTDMSKAIFIPAKVLGTTSETIVTSQSAYNNSNPDPEVTTNAPNGPMGWRQGTGSDSDDVIEVQNGSGTQKFSVTGEGNVSANDLEIDTGTTTSEITITSTLSDLDLRVGVEFDVIYKHTSGIAIMDFLAKPLDGTSDSEYRYGVSNGSSGHVLVKYFDTNSTNIQTQIASSGQNTWFNAFGGKTVFGGQSGGTGKIHVIGDISLTGEVLQSGNAIVEIFQTLKSGSQVTTGTAAALTGWAAATGKNGGTAPCTLASGTGQITMDKTGWYAISCWVEVTASSSDRTQLIIELQDDTSGSFVNIAGARDAQYARRNATYTNGSAQISNFMIEYTAGDIIRVMISDVGDVTTVNTDTARFSIKYYGN